MNPKLESKLNILKNIQQIGFFHLLSANILIQIVSFASQLFVAGLLSPDDIGRIKIVQTYLSIFSIVASFGFNSSTLKLCSENRSDNEKKRMFTSALFFTFCSTICIYIITILLNSFGVFSSDKLIQFLIPLGLFSFIPSSIFMIFISYFQANKEIKLISKLTVSNKLLTIVAIIIFTYIGGIKGYYLAYNLSLILIVFVCFRFFGFSLNKKIFSFSNFIHFPTHWKYAKKSMLGYLLSEISIYSDILLISFFIKDMQQIGFYSLALTITIFFRIIPSTIQQITIPYFSLHAQNKDEFLLVYKRYNKILYQVIGITLTIALLFVPLLLNWVFIGKYATSMHFFPFLAIGWSLRLLAQVQYGAIFGLGKLQYNINTSLITLVLNIIIISISLYFYGLIGAAYSSIICGLIYFGCSKYFFNKATSEI
jgi:O-antigen/teichoic acid export membrane protein